MEWEKEGAMAGEELKVQIKFGGQTIPLSLPNEATVSQLKTQVQSATNVLPRGQKLIHKGKVLEQTGDDSLRSLGITNGSKIMLMASQGVHQGEGPKLNDAPVVPNYQKIMNAAKPNGPTRPATADPPVTSKSRSERWKITRVVALSDSNLEAIPDEVWDCGSSSVRVLDVSNNRICKIPIQLGSLLSIQKLMLHSNELSDDSISWEGLSQLKNLTYLSLNQNHLTYLPSLLGALTSLEQLHVAGNKLATLPMEIGRLTRLEVLKINANRINALPASIGDCCSLIEVDLSSNILVDLPEAIGSLKNLKALHLSNNGLRSLPSTLFKNCVKLSTVDLHGTEITMDMLREVEGWVEFDERRRLKHQKQLDFRAGSSAVFDEGADKN